MNAASRKQRPRLEQIRRLLTSRQIVRVGEIAEACGVSEITTRRDLKILEAEGVVSVFGGAASLVLDTGTVPLGDTYYLAQQTEAHRAEKARIGEAAQRFVADGETIVIDMGSTPYFFARELSPDLNLTVACYALNTFIEVHERGSFSVFFAGGFFNRDSLICGGPSAVSALRGVRAHSAFITGAGFDREGAITTGDTVEQELKQAAIAISARRYLLLDSSKFGTIRPAHVADIAIFDAVVTDAGVPDEYARRIRDSGVELVVV